MKLKSAAGIVCYVKNLDQTALFYETLGFQLKIRQPDHVTAYLNWFWLDFLPLDQANNHPSNSASPKAPQATCQSLHLSVENVDDAYSELLEKNLQPTSPPYNRPGGIREFTLQDPDGNNLTIFKKK